MGMQYVICQWATNRFRPSELTKHHPRCPLTVKLLQIRDWTLEPVSRLFEHRISRAYEQRTEDNRTTA